MYSSQISKTSSAKPGPTSLLEELMAKISLRNIRIDENNNSSRPSPQIPRNPQPKICETPRNWRNPSNNTAKISNSAGMDDRKWPNSGGRWPNSYAMDHRSKQSAELSGTSTTNLSHDFTLPPLRNATSIRSSNSYTKLNPANNRQFTPGGSNHTAMDSNTQYRCVTPQSPKWRDMRPFSASKQFPPRGNSNRKIEDFEFPIEQNFKDFHLPQIRNSDDFHLPPIQFKQRQTAGQYGGSGSRPKTTFYGTHSTEPSAHSVSEVVKMFEQNSPQNRPASHAYNSRTSPLLNPYETAQEEPTGIQPDDDCPTRIGKIRRTLQQFDQSVPLYERCTTIDGTTELDYRTSEAERSHSFLALQNGSTEDYTENKNIDRSSLVRVTKFKAAKPTRKSSKTKLRNTRQGETCGSMPSVDKEAPPTPNNNNLQEYEENDLPVIKKPSWMRRIVETGSEVNRSVHNTWDSVNYQVGSKLRSVYGNAAEIESIDSIEDDTRME